MSEYEKLDKVKERRKSKVDDSDNDVAVAVFDGRVRKEN